MKYLLNMFMHRTAPLILVISLMLMTACQQDKSQLPVSSEVSFALSQTEWTYFCFATGEVVGTSKFGDQQQDAQWAERLDWDIAFCSDLIRTNSGTSGRGEGGIQRNTTSNFFNLTEAPEDGYIIDTEDFPVFD